MENETEITKDTDINMISQRTTSCEQLTDIPAPDPSLTDKKDIYPQHTASTKISSHEGLRIKGYISRVHAILILE